MDHQRPRDRERMEVTSSLRATAAWLCSQEKHFSSFSFTLFPPPPSPSTIYLFLTTSLSLRLCLYHSIFLSLSLYLPPSSMPQLINARYQF